MDSINNHACKFGTDAWLELQAFKTRQLNRREKLNRHKNLHKDLASLQSPQGGQQASANQPGANPSSPHRAASAKQLAQHNDTSIEDSLPTNNNNNNSSSALNNSSSSLNLESPPSSSLQDQRLPTTDPSSEQQQINLDLVECLLLLKLCDVALKLPIDSKSLRRSICKIRGLETTPRALIENLLQKFAHQELISIEEPSMLSRRKTTRESSHEHEDDDEFCFYVTSADHTKLVEFDKSFGSLDHIRALLVESRADDSTADECEGSVPIQSIRTDGSCNLGGSTDSADSRACSTSKLSNNCCKQAGSRRETGDDLERLLSLSSTRERENKKLGEELLELLSKPTAKERNLLERFRSADGYQVQEFCPKGTKGECRRNHNGLRVCDKLHFKKIIAKHTEESLGDCSFLNTCFHMDSCKYVHYEVDYDTEQEEQQSRELACELASSRSHFKRPLQPAESRREPSLQAQQATVPASLEQVVCFDKNNNNNNINNNKSLNGGKLSLSAEEQALLECKNRKRFKTVLYPPQWIQCDLRFFDMSLLGKFSVVMADPPWDIHMELPYGTMSDDEMRKLNIPTLQDEGVIFLWVTGRAMELGRECLALWGYERCDEIIWVKTNQLQRIIRTGRTGHWLNHGKEHCLVGVKGNPKDINRGLDCDVIVAEVRATSHKPDEIYGIIERLSPGTRKIELFGRAHNVQPNWITLGNQLNGVRLVEPSLVNAFKKLKLPFQTAEQNGPAGV